MRNPIDKPPHIQLLNKLNGSICWWSIFFIKPWCGFSLIAQCCYAQFTLSARTNVCSLIVILIIFFGGNYFICERCGESCNRKDILKRHIKKHSQETTHQCQHCSRKFYRHDEERRDGGKRKYPEGEGNGEQRVKQWRWDDVTANTTTEGNNVHSGEDTFKEWLLKFETPQCSPDLTPCLVIGLKPHPFSHKHHPFLFLIARMYIWTCKTRVSLPRRDDFPLSLSHYNV